MQGLLYQQAAESRAVDEQIAFDGFTAFERDALHVPAFSVLVDVGDLPFGSHHPSGFGQLAQIPGIERGIEMEGVGYRAEG